MEYKFTKDSIMKSLNAQGNRCIRLGCTGDISFTFVPGNTQTTAVEQYICSTCQTSWVCHLVPSTIRNLNYPGPEDPGLSNLDLDSICSREAVIDIVKEAFEEFLEAMSKPGITSRAQVIARIANLLEIESVGSTVPSTELVESLTAN